MDGFKKRLNQSIQLKLSFSLTLAIVLVAVVAAVFSFVSAFDEAHELQDDTLHQIAALLERQPFPLTQRSSAGDANDSDEESRVIVQYLTDRGETVANGNGAMQLQFPTTLSEGLQTLMVGSEPFRVLVKTTASGMRIAVAQETGVRDQIARDSAMRSVLPFLLLFPVLLLIVADLVRKMFRPIAALSTEIDQRTEQALHAVEQRHLPVEVRPFVVAINRLLMRIAQSMDAQRRFVADAAHELRSPLTAISLQAERLAEADMPDLARERLATLQRGIARNRNLLDQMLTLAKVQAITDRPESPVSVQRMYRRVLEDLMPLADARGIDIGVEGQQDAQVEVGELDMITLVKNLVDNAIRHTPEGGRIDLSVSVTTRHAVLCIQDNGPGIPLAERQRVFDPFYRSLGSEQTGSGLGMSIVKAIAERIHAEIQLGFSDEKHSSGLRVCVSIPLKHGRLGMNE